MFLNSKYRVYIPNLERFPTHIPNLSTRPPSPRDSAGASPTSHPTNTASLSLHAKKRAGEGDDLSQVLADDAAVAGELAVDGNPKDRVLPRLEA